MSPRRQRAPINDVIDYFEAAPVEQIQVALDVVSNIVRRRTGGTAKPTTKKPTRPATRPAGPGPAPSTVGE